MKEHLQLHASHIRQKSQHTIHYLTIPMRKKQTPYNTDYITDFNTNTIHNAQIKTNMNPIHTSIVNTENTTKSQIYHSPYITPMKTRHTLAQP